VATLTRPILVADAHPQRDQTIRPLSGIGVAAATMSAPKGAAERARRVATLAGLQRCRDSPTSSAGGYQAQPPHASSRFSHTVPTRPWGSGQLHYQSQRFVHVLSVRKNRRASGASRTRFVLSPYRSAYYPLTPPLSSSDRWYSGRSSSSIPVCLFILLCFPWRQFAGTEVPSKVPCPVRILPSVCYDSPRALSPAAMPSR
jgi:hypothetical protein